LRSREARRACTEEGIRTEARRVYMYVLRRVYVLTYSLAYDALNARAVAVSHLDMGGEAPPTD